MPRTTLTIDDDVMKIAKAYATRHRTTLGKAVSELVRQGTRRPLITDSRSGLQVVHLGRGSPKVTTSLIDQLRECPP